MNDTKKYRFMARIIDNFVDSFESGWTPPADLPEYAWDDYLVSQRHGDALLDRVATECARIDVDYPAKGQYCSDEGFRRLRDLAQELRDAADKEGLRGREPQEGEERSST